MLWSDASDKAATTLLDSLRTAADAKGRDYENSGCEPEWLAGEVAGHCGTQGWGKDLKAYKDDKGCFLLVLDQGIAVLIEGTRARFSVKVKDVRPEKLKSTLALGSALLLTGGLGIIALPAMGHSVWCYRQRKAVVNNLLAAINERVNKPRPSGHECIRVAHDSVAQRLRDLESLKNDGLVSGEEYEEKRRMLLQEL